MHVDDISEPPADAKIENIQKNISRLKMTFKKEKKVTVIFFNM
jgi:hypothetical protein